jgi:exportin-T
MQACRSSIEHISNIDKSLHTEVVANIVGGTLNTLQTSGPSAVPWQQAELALHLVYTFGEMAKSESSQVNKPLADNRQHSCSIL